MAPGGWPAEPCDTTFTRGELVRLTQSQLGACLFDGENHAMRRSRLFCQRVSIQALKAGI